MKNVDRVGKVEARVVRKPQDGMVGFKKRPYAVEDAPPEGWIFNKILVHQITADGFVMLTIRGWTRKQCDDLCGYLNGAYGLGYGTGHFNALEEATFMLTQSLK